jgi:Tol biopolymer transport system component/serine/threonine protein kinase
VGGALQLGTGFAGYRLDAVIGRGGMAEVFLAQDPRLKRNVALKVLSPELADEEEFRARFARESELAASIDHPNIVPIYEAGEFEGRLYIAMRYVEGQDLGTILEQRGRLAPAEALPIFEQVGKALDAAHARGLVHRDVKPANILIVGDVSGSAPPHCYLCDFGLTKRISALTDPTLTGHIMGTLDYISPEQIRGESIDGRADVYALGCVIYQTLTGHVPFAKDEDVAVIYAHLNDPPPRATAASPDLPEALDAVVATALAKDRDLRYPTCGALVSDTRHALGDAAQAPPGVTSTVAPPPQARPRRRRGRIAVGVAALLAAAGVGAFLLTRGGSSSTPTPTAIYSSDDFELFTLVLAGDAEPVRLTTNRWVDGQPAWGPEGKIAFTSHEHTTQDIYVINADGTGLTQLTRVGREDTGPAWSPDGSQIAFVSDRGSAEGEAIFVMNATDGSAQRLLTDGPGHDGSPAWSHDGTMIAFASERAGTQKVFIYDIDTGQVRQLTTGTGTDGRPSWSPDDQQIAFSRDELNTSHIYVINLDGTGERRLTKPITGGTNPTWSPDGDRIAYVGIRRGNRDIFLISPDGRTESRLTRTIADERDPSWSPEGDQMVYAYDVGHPAEP